MESGPPGAQLHLKVLAYHGDRVCADEELPLVLLDLKQVLVPRQWFLKKLDPRGNLTVPALKDLLRQHMLEYKASSYWIMLTLG